MSTNFSLLSNNQRSAASSALVKRRQRAFIRKIIIVLCIGIMSLLVISSIIEAQATQVIPVAAHRIQQGKQLTINDISYIRVPQHPVFKHVLSEHVNSYNTLVATCEIQAGMPILLNEISRVPNIPEGFTSISVHLASADHTLIPGEKIDLAFSKPLQEEADTNSKVDENNSRNKTESAQNDFDKDSEETDTTTIDKRFVTVVRNVIVMRLTHSQESSQNQQNNTTLAMPAADALKLIQAQSVNPSLAIVAMKNSSD